MAIRRNPAFRFDYFLRSISVDLLGKRCEQLMKAAEKEVEHLERQAREHAGLPVEPGEDGKPLPPIQLPEMSIMREQIRKSNLVLHDYFFVSLMGLTLEFSLSW